MFNQWIIIDIHQQSFFKTWQDCDSLLKERTLPDAAPSKKQNEIVSNLEEPDEIMANNFQPLPSQDWRKTTTAPNLLKVP